MSKFQEFVKGVFRKFGLDISKLGDVENIKLYKKLYKPDSLENKRFYNVGAGTFRHPFWTNIDYTTDWYNYKPDINMDLLELKPFPVEDCVAEIVYTSHTIEHITDEAVQNVFNEAHRILKSGGVFRATTPDIDLDYRAYRDNDREYFYWMDLYETWRKKGETAMINKPMSEATIGEIFIHHFATSISPLHHDGAEKRISDEELARIFSEMEYEEALDYLIYQCPLETQRKYPGDHINWWNKGKLTRMLKKAGFDNVYLSGYGQSVTPILRNTTLFDNTHPKASIYVEAVK